VKNRSALTKTASTFVCTAASKAPSIFVSEVAFSTRRCSLRVRAALSVSANSWAVKGGLLRLRPPQVLRLVWGRSRSRQGRHSLARDAAVRGMSASLHCHNLYRQRECSRRSFTGDSGKCLGY
jgi:hypothetical protein